MKKLLSHWLLALATGLSLAGIIVAQKHSFGYFFVAAGLHYFIRFIINITKKTTMKNNVAILVLFILTSGLFTACQKDDIVNSPVVTTVQRGMSDAPFAVSFINEEERLILKNYLVDKFPTVEVILDDATTISYTDSPDLKIITAKDPNNTCNFYLFSVRNGAVEKLLSMTYIPSQDYLDACPELFKDPSIPYDGLLTYSVVGVGKVAEYHFGNGQPTLRQTWHGINTWSDCMGYYGGQWYVWAAGLISPWGAFGGVALGCGIAVAMLP